MSSLSRVNYPPEKFQPSESFIYIQKEALAYKERTVDLFVWSGVTKTNGSITKFHPLLSCMYDSRV